MNLNLSNKTFLISGSSKGIGLKIAETLLSEGANVIITGRSKNLIKNQFNKLYSKFRLKVAYTNGDIKSNLVLKKIKNITFKRIYVPGIFEIPIVISKNLKFYDGFIALGCVIKGKTPHFKIISKSVINAIMNLSVYYKKPIGNGIITCFNKKQSIERSSNKNNKGREAAKAVLSVLKIF